MFNLIYHYIFIPVSGCVGRSPSALLRPGANYAVKMALVETVYSHVQRVIAILLIISIFLLELLHSDLTIELSNLNVYTYDRLLS